MPAYQSLKIRPLVTLAFAAVLPMQALAGSGSDTQPVLTAGLIEEVGGSERINFSGKLRMLSQRIPAAACNFNAGIQIEASRSLLDGAVAEFEKILNALEFGDESLGIIGAEERRKTLHALEGVKKQFAPIQTSARQILDNEASEENVRAIIEANMDLLNAAKLLVSEISGQYSNPAELVQSDALRIDIAGRQRMLTQKVSKEVCQVASGIYAEDASKNVSSTSNMFTASLNALQNGMPSAGIQASNDPNIVEGLSSVLENWQVVAPHLETLNGGAVLQESERADVFEYLNKTMFEMNEVVKMYSQASKLEI